MSKIPQHLHKMVTKQEREARKNRPPFKKTRAINFRDVITSRDLWLGIYMFSMFQLSIILLTLAAASEQHGNKFMIASMVVAVGVSIHGLAMAKHRQRVVYKYTPTRPLRTLSYVGAIYAGVFAISVLFVTLDWNIPVQDNQESLNLLLSRYFLPMTFITGVVAPITEELTFREFLPYAFGPSYLSFALSSLVFMWLHSPDGLIGFAMYGFMAVGFMYIRLKDNNIVTAIYTHMGYNLLTVLLSLL